MLYELYTERHPEPTIGFREAMATVENDCFYDASLTGLLIDLENLNERECEIIDTLLALEEVKTYKELGEFFDTYTYTLTENKNEIKYLSMEKIKDEYALYLRDEIGIIISDLPDDKLIEIANSAGVIDKIYKMEDIKPEENTNLKISKKHNLFKETDKYWYKCEEYNNHTYVESNDNGTFDKGNHICSFTHLYDLTSPVTRSLWLQESVYDHMTTKAYTPLHMAEYLIKTNNDINDKNIRGLINEYKEIKEGENPKVPKIIKDNNLGEEL